MTTNPLINSWFIAASLILGCAAPLQADIIHFEGLLSGAAEDPPNASPGTGSADVFYDSQLHTLRVETTFSGLLAPSTAAHIHAPTAVPFEGTAGVATPVPFFPGFPIGVQSGSYDHTLDLTLPGSYNPAFLSAQGGSPAAAEAALASALQAGKAYLNIHSTDYPRGEIRAFLSVPDASATAPLLAVSLAALALLHGLRKFEFGR